MILKNVRFTSYNCSEPFNTSQFDKETQKELEPFIKNNYLSEKISDLRKVSKIISNYGLTLRITNTDFEFFDGNY